MDTITSFDEWVRLQRKVLDITQAQLAARVGCAVVTIKKIEQATRRPSRQLAELLAEALVIPEAQRDAFLRLARHQYVAPDALPSPYTISPQPSSGDTTARAAVDGAAIDVAGKPRHFVARERQMAQLDAHLTGALNGSGRIVFIAGEAGYGKTMLMAEFARHALATYPDLIVAGGNCDAYAGAGNPYLPFREIMALLTGQIEASGHAGLLSQDQARRLWRILPQTVQLLVDHGPDLLDVFVAEASLLHRAAAHSMVSDSSQAALDALAQRQPQPGDVRQRKLFEQYVQLLRALAGRQPLLLLLDDLQWIDRASADLLLHAARQLAGSRILFLATYRRSEVESAALSSHTSEEQVRAHPLTPLHQELRRHYGDIEIDLDQLPPQKGRTFVDALLDSEPNQLAEPFRTALFQRTQGHPLFTVELLQDMQERGDLVQDSQGRWIEGDAVDWDALPARVEAVISRRISRLPATLQEALKIASVEGESFTAEVIAHILGVDDWQMVQQVSGVAGRQHYLVSGRGSRRLGDQLLSRYRFVHILFQSYLYTNLDAAERAYLHEAVGNALEQLAAQQTEAVAVQLAHHFQAAGLTAKAIQYLHRAGRQSVALSAHQEAITHFTAALALLADLPDTTERARLELQIQTELGVSVRITNGFGAPEVERVYLRARMLCEQVGEPLSWGCVLWGLNSVYTVRGELRSAIKSGQECLRLSQTQDDPVLRTLGPFTLGVTVDMLGQLRASRAYLEQTMELYSTQQHSIFVFLAGIDPAVFSLAHLAHIHCYLGFPAQALQLAQESLDLAQTLAHPFSYASALSYLTMLHQLRRDWCALQAVAASAHRLCVEHDIPYYLAWTTFLQGWALSEQPDAAPDTIEQGIAQMEQSLIGLQALGTGLRRPYYLGLLAEAHGKVGRVEEGLHLVADGLVQAREQEQLLYEPDLLRIQGELLRMQHAAGASAAASFQQAIDLAQQQEAKLCELRAATSLARLYQSQGRRDEAHDTLAAVLEWFSEGFDTADLQEATLLLAALA